MAYEQWRKWTVAAVITGGVLSTGIPAKAEEMVGNHRVPEPAKAVDLDRYVGNWYEFARYDNLFERNCEGVTAQYEKRNDGLIRVVNVCREGSATGPARSIEGKAQVIENSQNAKLKVSFFGPFYVGRYWVLDHADDYSWSIVGEPTGLFLWILTRDAKPSQTLADALIVRATQLGYDASKIRKTQQ